MARGRCGQATQTYNPRVTCELFCGLNAAGRPARTAGPHLVPGMRSGDGTQADFNFG